MLQRNRSVRLVTPCFFEKLAAPPALPEVRKRDRVPIATVFPRLFDLKTSATENTSDGLVRELVTVLRVNCFAARKVKIKFRVRDTYILFSRTFEVHLDPRLAGIPKHTM